MNIEGEYIPSRSKWVSDQIDAYEASGGIEGNSLFDTGIPIIVVTMRGHRSGNVRKIALMRVEHEGQYALVASMGGAPSNPGWYKNLVADPDEVFVQDGPTPVAVSVREVFGEERALWWQRSVAVYPSYADYEAKTDRIIPVFVTTNR
ncbi:MAG: nitroreductase family deazaflavin-dependent oxidoreductase [Actinomycetota bacterium]